MKNPTTIPDVTVDTTGFRYPFGRISCAGEDNGAVARIRRWNGRTAVIVWEAPAHMEAEYLLAEGTNS